MLGPNHVSQQMATRSYDERLNHAARIQMIKRDRQGGDTPVDRGAHRRMTVARLAGAVTAVLFSVALAAGAAAASPAVGGGATILIR